jgi:AraC-like DNA-binding protein
MKFKITLITFFLGSWLLWFYYGQENKVEIYPHQIGKAFTDQSDGGNSEISAHANKGLTLNWTLKNKYEYPYVGWEWILINSPQKKDSCKTFKNFSRLEIEARSAKPTWVTLNLNTNTTTGISRLFSAQAQIQNKTILIQHSQFEIPEWFRAENKIDPSLIRSSFEKICRIEFSLQDPSPTQGQIQIQKISVVQKGLLDLWIPSLISLVLSLIWAITSLMRRKNKNNAYFEKNAALPIPSSIDSIEKTHSPLLQAKEDILPLAETIRLKQVLENDFCDPNLTLESWAERAQTTPTRASKWLKHSFGQNFRSILNELRLKEAERWLKDTDEQIAQIATRCGYSNVTHFHRVFKEKHPISPREWRKSQTPPST